MNIKLETAIHYIASLFDEKDELSNIKLNKILWFVDVITFEQTFDSITRVRYLKALKGPVVEWGRSMNPALKKLQENKKIEIPALDYNGNPESFITHNPLSKDKAEKILGEEATELIEITASFLSKYDDGQVSKLTHNLAYKQATINEELPLYTAFIPEELIKELPDPVRKVILAE